jgi:hypothetical protein
MNQEEQAKKIQKVIAKAWADEAFKQRLISQPSETLREEGVDTPPDVELCVVESTDKLVYLILPPRPTDMSIEAELVERRLAPAGWF